MSASQGHATLRGWRGHAARCRHGSTTRCRALRRAAPLLSRVCLRRRTVRARRSSAGAAGCQHRRPMARLPPPMDPPHTVNSRLKRPSSTPTRPPRLPEMWSFSTWKTTTLTRAVPHLAPTSQTRRPMCTSAWALRAPRPERRNPCALWPGRLRLMTNQLGSGPQRPSSAPPLHSGNSNDNLTHDI